MFTTMHQVPRQWDYDHLKYNNKRDPSIQEIESALQQYDIQLYKEMVPVIQKLVAMKDDIREKYCCITHAVSQNILNLDSKNLCRNINKLTLNAFFEQIGLK